MLNENNNNLKSLDPRVKRLPVVPEQAGGDTKNTLDQFTTFEVFVQPKEGKAFQHEGAVHAPNLELAYILAKETFTRRFTCVSLYVAETLSIWVSPMTEGSENVYDQIPVDGGHAGENETFEIYHLFKRGKQHVHVGQVTAPSPTAAMAAAKTTLGIDKMVFNVWAIPTAAIRFTKPEESDLWLTLPEKKFRDAADYKGGDKLKAFLERTNGGQ